MSQFLLALKIGEAELICSFLRQFDARGMLLASRATSLVARRSKSFAQISSSERQLAKSFVLVEEAQHLPDSFFSISLQDGLLTEWVVTCHCDTLESPYYGKSVHLLLKFNASPERCFPFYGPKCLVLTRFFSIVGGVAEGFIFISHLRICGITDMSCASSYIPRWSDHHKSWTPAYANQMPDVCMFFL